LPETEEAMAYDVRVVANYFLDLAARDHVFVSPLKLQKIVYLAHGWSLALRGQPLLKQSIEAWRYGPVIPALYREFKEFGGSAIVRKARLTENVQELDAETKKLIDAVWERYKSLSATQLSALTHEPGSAWDLTRREFRPLLPSTSVIPDDLIADEFERRRQQK
jgi:uncharacterized phage-associated protein